MKKVKQFSRSYIFEKSAAKSIQKVLELFQAKHIFIEVIGTERDSSFYKEMQRKKDEYGLIFTEGSPVYSDIFISNCFSEGVAEITDRVIDNCPEMLIFYLTNLPLEDFLSYDRKRNADKMIARQVAVCICTVIFDENTFSVSFNSDLFYSPDYISKIDGIICK